MGIPFDDYIILPIAMVLYSMGNWESWVDKYAAGGILDELYKVCFPPTLYFYKIDFLDKAWSSQVESY